MSNLPANLQSLMTGLQSAHQRTKALAGSAGEQYLRLQKTGVWTYGADDIDVQENSAWAVDPNSFVMGFIAWEPDDNKAAEKLGEEMRAATDKPILRADLPEVGGPWDEQLGMTLLCLNGEDKGTKVIYNTTSKGGLRAVNEVLGAVVMRLQEGENDQIIPVVHLHVDSYQHKRYGKVHVPVFAVVKWENLSNTPKAAAAEMESATEDPPADDTPPDAPSADAPAPEPSPTTPANSRRRRRAAA